MPRVAPTCPWVDCRGCAPEREETPRPDAKAREVCFVGVTVERPRGTGSRQEIWGWLTRPDSTLSRCRRGSATPHLGCHKVGGLFGPGVSGLSSSVGQPATSCLAKVEPARRRARPGHPKGCAVARRLRRNTDRGAKDGPAERSSAEPVDAFSYTIPGRAFRGQRFGAMGVDPHKGHPGPRRSHAKASAPTTARLMSGEQARKNVAQDRGPVKGHGGFALSHDLGLAAVSPYDELASGS